jgi:hypothetical protein
MNIGYINMSRLPRYIDSLNKFIKDRSCLTKCIDSSLIKEVEKSDIILSIIFLTIMNSQNKKKQISAQGYYAATSILLLTTILNLSEQQDKTKYNMHIKDLLIYINKSISQNLENTKHLISSNEMSFILNLYSNYLDNDNLLNLSDIKESDSNTQLCLINDVGKLYIQNHKNGQELAKLHAKLLKVDDSSYTLYIDKKYGTLSEIAFCASWAIGCGNMTDIPKLKRLSKQFAYMYKISLDFENLEKDLLAINDTNNKSKNYVINNGIQASNDDFLKHKQKFIENCMLLDIFSNTIREILNYIEKKMDVMIDNTTPDLKSNFTPEI